MKPSTPLEVILPRNGRRKQWQRIQNQIQLRLPDLHHSGLSFAALLFVGIALTVGPGIYGRVGFAWLALLFLLGLVVGGFLVNFSPSLAVAFPGATVGDLAKDVLAINHAKLATEIGGWNRKEVWETLCHLIVMQTGVDREKITKAARIVDDLGID